MNIENLTEIIRLANTRKINKQLEELGYINCAKHKQYKYISLVDIFKGDSQETEVFSDCKGKLTYEGGIITNVQGYEQLEFILININDDKHPFPIKMFVWAKEIEEKPLDNIIWYFKWCYYFYLLNHFSKITVKKVLSPCIETWAWGIFGSK